MNNADRIRAMTNEELAKDRIQEVGIWLRNKL